MKKKNVADLLFYRLRVCESEVKHRRLYGTFVKSTYPKYNLPQLEGELQADQYVVQTVLPRVAASHSHDLGLPWLHFAPLEDEHTNLSTHEEDQTGS